MKFSVFISIVLFLLLVTSCETTEPKSEDPYLVSSEIFYSRIGSKQAYGVQLRLSADKKTYVKYAIELKVNEQVWLDTLSLEIPGGDTLESELVFSGSKVEEDDLVELNLTAIPIE